MLNQVQHDKKGMLVGTHVSIAGGIFHAPENAAKIGCETFQMFTRSPRGGAAPTLSADVVAQFKTNCKKFDFKNYYVHAPYYVNLASAKPMIATASVRIIREDLERSSLLGVKALMAHLGSAKDRPRDKAIRQTIAGLKKILTGYQGTTQFLIEISAGSGNVIGDTFDEVAEIINGLKPKIGVCFDTAHAFASGYDLRTTKTVNDTIKRFDRLIGLKHLALLHGNDSKVDFNAHVDRHWHIGQGKIGREGFEALINHPRLKKLDMILETPDATKDKMNLKTVKDLRK